VRFNGCADRVQVRSIQFLATTLTIAFSNLLSHYSSIPDPGQLKLVEVKASRLFKEHYDTKMFMLLNLSLDIQEYRGILLHTLNLLLYLYCTTLLNIMLNAGGSIFQTICR
jgi:hypothetical protein